MPSSTVDDPDQETGAEGERVHTHVRRPARMLGADRRQRLMEFRSALRRLVDHRVCVVHAHAVGARMLAHDRHNGVISFLACPVALPFAAMYLKGDLNLTIATGKAVR
jgi:hypothetical protein